VAPFRPGVLSLRAYALAGTRSSAFGRVEPWGGCGPRMSNTLKAPIPLSKRSQSLPQHLKPQLPRSAR
jgi:hypothetical protein